MCNRGEDASSIFIENPEEQQRKKSCVKKSALNTQTSGGVL
jgi:hypothetical protein